MNNGGVYRSKKIHDSDAGLFFAESLFSKYEKDVSVTVLNKYINILYHS